MPISPVTTTLAELVALQASATALTRLRRRPSSSSPAGASVSRKLGRGLDFAEVREYQPGDDVRMIDWNVTARSGRTHTKLFIEERERPVLLLVDLRGNMNFATRGVFKSALAVRLAALLGWCAVSANERVGGLVFTDHGHREIRPQAGRRGLMPLLRAMTEHSMNPTAGPWPASAPGVPGAERTLERSLARLRHVAQAGSTVVLLSDFLGFAGEARSNLGGLLHRLDLLAVQVVDPIDVHLPPAGRYAVVDRHRSGAGPMMIDTHSAALAQRHRQRFIERERELTAFFARGRHLLTRVQTDEPLLDTAARVLLRQRSPKSS